MKKKSIIICTAVVVALVAINVNLAFNSNSNINFSLSSIEALARGETLYCSICGDQVDACRCPPAVTCDYNTCRGKQCYHNSYNWVCPCIENGNPNYFCA